MVGQSCSAWRKSYGRSGHLHFGPLTQREAHNPRAVYQDRGLWVLHLWNCERTLVWSDGTVWSSRQFGDAPIFEHLSGVIGVGVKAIDLQPHSLDLRVSFANGAVLQLGIGHDVAPDDEQWNLITPASWEIVLWANHEWGLLPAGR